MLDSECLGEKGEDGDGPRSAAYDDDRVQLDANFESVLSLALRAPSLFNSQPWRLHRLGPTTVEARVDESHAAPAADPVGRQLTVSLGTFLTCARWAARGHGWQLQVHAVEGSPTARRLELSRGDQADQLALDAVRARWTCRSPLPARPLPDAFRSALEALDQPPVLNAVVDDTEGLVGLAELVRVATRRSYASSAFRRELAAGVDPSSNEAGLLPSAGPLVGAGRWILARGLELVDVGPMQSEESAELIRACSAVVLITTDSDDRAAWVLAGEVLAEAWLLATRHGLWAQPMTAVIESPEDRTSLSDALGGRAVQAMLRIGWPRGVAPAQTARRALDSFWD